MKIACVVFLIFGALNLLGKEKKAIQKDWVLKTFHEKKAREAVRTCYEEVLKVNPELEGKVLVDLEIGSDGSVQEVKIESSTMNNQTVENCLIEKIKTFKFPPPPQKTVVQVKFPFNFSKASKH